MNVGIGSLSYPIPKKSDLGWSASRAFNYILFLLYLYFYHFFINLGADYGDYICEVRNSLGSNYATVNLFGNN